MTLRIETIEKPTQETLRSKNYAILNPDLASYLKSGQSAATHFEKHGQKEGRLQLSRAFTDERPRRSREKYRHFKPVFDASAGARGVFRKKRGWFEPLPLVFGGPPNNLADYAAESANAGLHEFVVELNENPQGHYLDLGCGFRSVVYSNCLYVDVYPSLTADVIMEPACIYPFKDNSFDGISCLAVLEHVEEPWTVAKELRRMLKPGGKVFIDWPFLQPVHGYPSHFYNATREGLARMFRDGFELVKIDTFPNQTPDHTLAWILRELVGSIASHEIKEELLAASVGDLLRTPPGEGIWSRVTASVSEKTLMGLACGNTLIAKKRM